jgi:hypothetical protein
LQPFCGLSILADRERSNAPNFGLPITVSSAAAANLSSLALVVLPSGGALSSVPSWEAVEAGGDFLSGGRAALDPNVVREIGARGA